MSDIKLETKQIGSDYFQFKDIVFDERSDIKKVSGKDYAKQKIAKLLMTSYYSIFPNYGVNLTELLNQRLTASSLEALKNSIIAGLIYLETVETSDSPDERIVSINRLDISIRSNEIIIDLEVSLLSGDTVNLTLGV